MKSSLRLDRLEVARRIRAARLSVGVTQLELASRIGKPQSFTSKIETGEKQAGFLDVLLISRALDVPLADFVPHNFRFVSGKAEN